MPLFGSHLSIAGGYYKAVRAAADLGMDCVQIFTKNNNQWRAKPLSDEDVRLFRVALEETGIVRPISHDSYLINLGSSDPELWKKSIDALIIEIERASALGVPHVVAHPGSHLGIGEEAGLARIAAGLDQVLSATAHLTTTVALETTAGQGTNLGYRFEHLAAIIEQCAYPDRLTVCLDTCHVFAAGYELAPKSKYDATFRDFDKIIGINRLVALHINDSKKPLGSRVDRHEHIGHGYLGVEPFELLVNDRRFAKMPMYLETDKAIEPASGKPWDSINLAVLKGLIKKKSSKKS